MRGGERGDERKEKGGGGRGGTGRGEERGKVRRKGEERKGDVGGRVGRSRKGMSHSYGPVSVCKTSNLYNRLTFTVRNSPSCENN